MDILKLAQESLDYLKFEYDLPETGFIAGGSIANLIWEKVSGHSAAINDIDHYLFTKKVEINDQEIRQKQHFTHKESYLYEDYSGTHFAYRTKSFYVIDKVERDGIMNTIYYESEKPCLDTILRSFDINCCQIGYDIDNKQFLWTSHFEEFLKTGKLQIVNLGSPAHTAIRLVKKKNELSADFDRIELDMIEYCLNSKRFIDSYKVNFKDRYADMFRKYESELTNRFELVRNQELENWLISSGKSVDNIWKLEQKNQSSIFELDSNVGSISRSVDFIFYARNIFGNKNLEKVWYNLNHYFNVDTNLSEYLDTEYTSEDLELLNNLCVASAQSVNHLRGLSLSNQLRIVKSLLKRYESDPLVAISILENHRVDEIEGQDEFGMLLLELSVRKDILEDRKNKVGKLLGKNSIDEFIP